MWKSLWKSLPGLVFLAMVAPLLGWEIIGGACAVGTVATVVHLLWTRSRPPAPPKPVDPDALRGDPVF